MKTLNLILVSITLALVGCGKQESGGTAANPNGDNSPQNAKNGHTSFYVSDVSELKACTKDLYGDLAYVKATDSFMTCDDSGWVTVDVKGKDGVAGKDGTVVDNTVWVDPVTNISWKAYGVTQYGPVYDAASFSKICSGSYREPLAAEVLKAAQDGMYQYYMPLTTHQNVWVYCNGQGGTCTQVGYRRYDIKNATFTNAGESPSTQSSLQTFSAGVVCIKN